MTVVSKADFPAIIEIYNRDGRQAAYEHIKETYGLKRPYFLISRIIKDPDCHYNRESDSFEADSSTAENDIFMSLDELCKEKSAENMAVDQRRTDTRTMEKLVQELISDRLLELSRYITLETSSRTIIVDITSMKTDGYQVRTN